MSEVADCRQLLHLRNDGSWAEKLPAAGGVIIVGLALSKVRWRVSVVRNHKPVEPRGSCTLLVAVAEAKKGIWAQNCERGKVKRYDK